MFILGLFDSPFYILASKLVAGTATMPGAFKEQQECGSIVSATQPKGFEECNYSAGS
jgi:hypothetical protein